MTRNGNNLLAAIALVTVGALTSACSDSPTAPGTTTMAPAITSLSPATPTASSTAQTLIVTGTTFTSGLSLILKGPDTGATAYGPASITEQTATSFKAIVTMPVAGNWTATVRASDGTDSAQFPFTVNAPAGTNPQILSVGPTGLINASSAQTISITGVNFRSGLSLIVRHASGASATYNGASITGETATSFNAQVVLNSAGPYDLTVRNADGLESGVFTLTVHARPIVTAVGPSAILAIDGDQTILVTGINFEPGLTFVVKGPATGAVGHGTADVSDRTSVFFRARCRLHVAGDWTITVVNASGVASAEFAFRVN